MSCKRSIKANHYLNEAQARVLLKDLAQCENPFNCPMAAQYWFTLPTRIWKECSNGSKIRIKSERRGKHEDYTSVPITKKKRVIGSHRFRIRDRTCWYWWNAISRRTASRLCTQNGWRKARTVWEQKEKKDSLVIASDTTVVLNQEIMGKPEDMAEAEVMLKN